MKHRPNDRRQRNRPRDGDARVGRDSNARDAQGGRARETPGDRVARAFKGGGGRNTRSDERPARVDEHSARGKDERRARGDERHARSDERQSGGQESGARREEYRVRRDEPRARRDETRSHRETAAGASSSFSKHDDNARSSRSDDNVRSSRHDDGARRPREDDARRPRAEDDGAHVFGVQPVLEALRAGARPVERLTLAEGAHESRLREILEIARYADIPVRRVPRAELQRIAAGANHQGVVATIAAAHYTHADELLDALSARVGTNDPPLAVVLDGVEDPRNLGAVLRTTECAGAHGVFVPERRASGLTETVAKAAAGALEYVPVARVANVVRLLEELKGRGVWTVGTAADASKDYTEWDWTQPSAILLGGEGEGLRRLVRERCDVLVRIPLLGRIESLNVSVAAGVILYEAVRQRRAKKVQSAE
jgi:23S rRNA (guanosine2251-2'-O)-methyltransferase